MANVKLYTKKGDDGTTGLIGNERVSKSDVRVSAYGAVDETNAAIGVALATISNPNPDILHDPDPNHDSNTDCDAKPDRDADADHDANAEMTTQLGQIQADLFVVGAELATPEGKESGLRITAHDVARLEGWIDSATSAVPELKKFVLPGGCPLAAALHMARGVCRRAERDVVTLAETQEVGEHLLPYLNRLADLLFALARVANRHAGVSDIPWTPS